MENNNTDWISVQIQVPDNTGFADIYNMGVDPSSVTLGTKDSYKNMKKIKENPAFLTNNKFDDKKFDSYYNMSVKTLNAYKSSDFSVGSGNMPEMNLWEDTVTARALGQRIYKDPISVKLNKNPETNLKLAQKSNLGFINLNQWSDPQKSIAEVAQGQKVMDGATGKELDFTPEDKGGIMNAFGLFDEPLVIAAYDKDVTDKEGKVIHKKGDLKFDDKGLPRYETLAGRSASGKQLLSRMNTLTSEDSFANKFDFMDSDGIQKSIGGSIIKNAVQLLPLALGGPVGIAARAYFIADGLLQAGTEIGKALTGIIGGKDADKGEFYKNLNSIQAYGKQAKGSVSDHSKNNFFTFENILNLASDSVYQLMGQQAIAQWPARIKQYQIAKSLNLNPSLMTSLTKQGDEALSGVMQLENYIERYGMDMAKITIALSKNQKQLENIGKYSSYGATAFMSATSAAGISDVADDAGLDARDKGLLYLGYMSSLAPLFRMNVGKWVEGNHDIDDLAKGMNAALKMHAEKDLTAVLGTTARTLSKAEAKAKLAQEAAETAKDSLTGLAKLKGKGLDLMIAGKKLGASVAKRFENINTPLMGGLAEGFEEITEEVLQDGIKGIYNGLSMLGLTSTEGKRIDFEMSDMMTRYGQAFIGGAVGGMVFKFVDPQTKVKSFISEDMNEYIAAGFGDRLIESIKEKAANGEMPGSKTLSINRMVNENGVLEEDVWAPVNADNPVSQSDFIADRMISEIKAKMKQLQDFGLDNPDAFTEGKNKFYDALIDTRTDTDLRDRITATTNKMVELNREIASIDDNEVNVEAIKAKKEEFKQVMEEFKYLTSDESVDEYYRQGLFNLNNKLHSAFGVKTRQSFAKELIKPTANYSTLNAEDKLKVDTEYEKYRLSNSDTFGLRVDLRNARLSYENFGIQMEEFGGFEKVKDFNEALTVLREALVELNENKPQTGYTAAIVPTLDGKPINSEMNGATSSVVLFKIANDFFEKIKDVKYMPDFLHSELLNIIEDLKRNGLTNTGLTEEEIALLRKTLLDGNITYMAGTSGIQNLFKLYLNKMSSDGTTMFDIPANDDLMRDKDTASLSSMLKVLAKTNDIKDTSEEKAIYESRKAIIDGLTPEEANKIIANSGNILGYNQDVQLNLEGEFGSLIDPEFEIHPEILTLLEEVNLESILENAYADAYEGLFTNPNSALNLLDNINKQQFLSVVTGEKTYYNIQTLVAPANVLISHVLDDSLNKSGLDVKLFSDLDIENDELIAKYEGAIKEKAISPLSEFLADTINFKDRQFKILNDTGVANYVDLSDDFNDTISEHIAKTERIEAYLASLTYMNPRIKEWRESHKDIVPEKLRKEELTILDPLAYSTIFQTAAILTNELTYLKELNSFNKNNTLAKLLREDGRQLSSVVKTLNKIALIEQVKAALPSLENFINDPIIVEYVSDINTDNEELKYSALGQATKHETAIYKDFQNLTDEVKQMIIDATFYPIGSGKEDFRGDISDDAPLNDMHQTLYLAKIFGTSSIAYTQAISGQEVGEGTYDKITAAKMDPFPNQDAAIRLAYFNRYGDPIVKASLNQAFIYGNSTSQPITFKRDNNSVINTDNIITILGDPGAGKTKAIVAGILSLDNESNNDSVLLGAIKEHTTNLINGVSDADFSNRINVTLSKTISEFLVDLELVDSENKIIDISTNSKENLDRLQKLSLTKYNNTYEDDVVIANDLANTVNRITSKIVLFDDKGVFNKSLYEKLKNVRNIFIDEYTHANPIDIALISFIVENYNNSLNNDPEKKITITLAGDNNQLGFEVADLSRTFGDFIQTTTAVPLSISLRSGKDLINNTLIEIKNRTAQIKGLSTEEAVDPAQAARMYELPIRLNYTTVDNLPVGFFNQKTTEETKIEDLSFLLDHMDAIKSSPDSLVYIVNTEAQIPPAEALLRSKLGSDWKTYASVHTVARVQGREFKYAILDASPNMLSSYPLGATYRFLNTMLSRATEATLIIDRGQFDKYAQFTQAQVAKSIDQKRLTDEMLISIKENRQAITHAKLKGVEQEVVKKTNGVITPSVSSTIVPVNANSNFIPPPPVIERTIETVMGEIARLENIDDTFDSPEVKSQREAEIDALNEELNKMLEESKITPDLNALIANLNRKIEDINIFLASGEGDENLIAMSQQELLNAQNELLELQSKLPKVPTSSSEQDSSAEPVGTNKVTDEVTDDEFLDFTLFGIVPLSTLNRIASKNKAQITLTPREDLIYKAKVAEIDAIAKGIEKVETPKLLLPVLTEEDNRVLLNPIKPIDTKDSDLADDIAADKKYMINAYTSFTFAGDVKAINNLLQLETPLNIEDAEGELMFLKERLVYGVKEFGRGYFSGSTLLSALTDKGYRLRDTKVRIKASNRTPDLFTVGRGKWNNSFEEKPQNTLLILEAVIPNKNSSLPPFVFNLGMLDSLYNIQRVGSNVPSVSSFANLVKTKLAKDKLWISPEFTFDEWTKMSIRQEAKVKFEKDAKVNHYELQHNYRRNMRVTDPQVVIALPGTNADNIDWQKIVGKSVAFVTEHAELRGKNPHELYKIYSAQLANFNTDEYRNMSNEEKQAFIETLPKISGNLAPRPRLVSLIELDNPRHNFTAFITNYQAFAAKVNKGKLNEEVAEFEMSPYVLDRFVKSLLVVHRMLTDENSVENKAWFEANVLSKTKVDVLANIQKYMDQTMEEMPDFDFGGATAADLVGNETDVTALRTVDDLVKALEEFLFDNPKLIEGIFRTNSTNAYRTKGLALDTIVDMRNVLPSVLTDDKNKDFNKGVLKVKNLTIYNKLKPSFLNIITEAFIALGSAQTNNDPKLRNYSLRQVFKDGLIENFIIAGVGTNGRHKDNVIAPVVTTSLSKGFTTNAINIRPSSFYVDFDKMMETITAIESKPFEDPAERQRKEDLEKVSVRQELISYIKGLVAKPSDYAEYDELISGENVPKNKVQLEQLKAKGITLTLKPIATVNSIEDVYQLNSIGETRRFSDVVDKTALLNTELKVTDSTIIIEADYPDRIAKHTFDRVNGYNHIETVLFKNSNLFNAKDVAKGMIDSLGLTRESIVELTRNNDLTRALSQNGVVAKDFSSLKGTTIDMMVKTEIKPLTIGSVAIGNSGLAADSFISFYENGVKLKDFPMQDIIDFFAAYPTSPGVVEIASLPNHPRAEAKITAMLDDENNLNFLSTIGELIRQNIPNTTEEQDSEIYLHLATELGLPLESEQEGAQFQIDKEASSNYTKLQELIYKTNEVLVNPWGNSAGEDPKAEEIFNAYNELAKGTYIDNLHTSNGFVNNFSIFADNSWLKYQQIIDNAIMDDTLMGNPEIRNNILNLEAQLNKLTHDC